MGEIDQDDYSYLLKITVKFYDLEILQQEIFMVIYSVYNLVLLLLNTFLKSAPVGCASGLLFKGRSSFACYENY